MVSGHQRKTEMTLVTDGMQGVRGSSPLSSTLVLPVSGMCRGASDTGTRRARRGVDLWNCQTVGSL